MENELKIESYAVKGMTCAACASSLETHLKSKQGISSVVVNYPNKSVYIEFDSGKINLDNIQKAANDIGYEVIEEALYDGQAEFKKRIISLKLKLTVSTVLTLPVFVLSMFFTGAFPLENYLLLMLSIPVLGWAGSEFFTGAIKKARHLTTNMDTLVALSTGTAFLFSLFNTFFPDYLLKIGLEPHVYYESATVIITLILLGRYLEERAKYKTTGAINKLLGIQPRLVHIREENEIKIIPIHEAKKHQVFLVKPGEKIALDGIILSGNSHVDESMINGEPLPGSRKPGDYVFAGTINLNGALEVEIIKEAGETLLAQIINLVKKAQASKPPIQKLVDKISAIFVPSVISIAFLAFIFWYIYGPQPSFTYAFTILITVLIIACPCALGLATPTALMVGLGKAAELGILIKDAQSLELAYKIDALVLDKTGTITLGKPEVVESYWSKQVDAEVEKGILGYLESKSEHPLGKAISNHFTFENIRNADIVFTNFPGKGIQAEIKKHKYLVGSIDFMFENGAIMDVDINNQIQSKDNTISYFSKDGTIIAAIVIDDPLRSGTTQAISGLQKSGIELYLLSGDNEEVTERIAKEAGIKNYKGRVLPTEKGTFIVNLQKKGKVVAMVGDGINDSHALAEADIGIALASGTDIAMESAGITLMQSDIQHIKNAILLSKATVKTINQNLFWAFGYNVIALPVAAGILYPSFGFLLNPMIAGAAMAFSSISVVTNSLRLKNRKLT